jgi:hypothetical protein
MRFMLIHHLDEATLHWAENGPEFDDEEQDLAMEAWDAEMVARGILVGGGRLAPASQGTKLQVRDGELLRTDGPYAETKEQIAGYSILECADLEQAVEVSARHPTAAVGSFELRALLDG